MTTTSSAHYPYREHPLQGPAQLSWSDRNMSLDALHVLEAALAEPAPARTSAWLDNVRAALHTLADALDTQAHGDSEAASLLSEIATDEPRLLPRIERLRAEHASLRDAVRDLLKGLNAGGDDRIDIADIRDRAAELARRLRHHRAREADLIYEAVNLNLGTGD